MPRPAALFAAALLAVPAVAQIQLPKTPPGAPDVTRVKPGTYQADPYHTQVFFKVNHLGFSEFSGQFPNATGTLTIDPAHISAASVVMTIPIAQVATANGKLDAHLLTADFLDGDKYTTATFRSTRVVVSGKTARITGDLTLHGVTKPVTLAARFVGAGDNFMTKNPAVGFAATTTIKRSDFGVSGFVPLVSDEVELTINAAFERK